jgi:hypothetical protein
MIATIATGMRRKIREPTTEKGTISMDTSQLVFGKTQSVGKRLKKTKTNGHPLQEVLFTNGVTKRLRRRAPSLPPEDNTAEGLKALLAANSHYRDVPWPEPFNRTTHRLHLGDARDLSWIPDASVHLVVTSPPYWTPKEYAAGNEDQMGHFQDYERFLAELDRVWRECRRVVPLHSDIQVRAPQARPRLLTTYLLAQDFEWRY